MKLKMTKIFKLSWITKVSFIVLGVFLLISNVTFCSATIRFDKVENPNAKKSSAEETATIKHQSTNPRTLKLKQDFRVPLNRPRRDHQYATYKVPKNHNVLVDYGWTPRQLSSFATTNLLQGPPPSEYPYPAGNGGLVGGGAEEEDNVVAAGGHGHQQHGWGWGHSHGHKEKYKKSEVNSSAVGMLGFLGLLALVQNVLRQMNGGLGLGGGAGAGLGGGGAINPGGGAVIPGGGRRLRRSVTSNAFTQASSDLYETTAGIVPYLLNLNQIREGAWSLNCSSYEVCMLSQAASHGMTGRSEKQLIRNTLTSVVGEMLAPLTRHRKKEKDLRKTIDWAAKVGLKGDKCDEYFEECKA